MAALTEALQFVIRTGGEAIEARIDLAFDDQWVEAVRSPRDSVGATSLLIWVASRRVAQNPPIWEVEWEISSAACKPSEPDVPAVVFAIDGIDIVLPVDAPHVEHQNPRSDGTALTTRFVLLPRRVVCGRLALGPVAESHTLVELAAGMPTVNASILSRYGPANWPLPMFDQSVQNGKWLGKRMALLSALAAGVKFEGNDWGEGIHPEALACGWLRPYLEFNRGAPGGSGIFFLTGWQGVQHARYALLAHMLVMQRVKVAYTRPGFDHGIDGRPLSVDDYPGDSPNYNAVDVELQPFVNWRWVGEADSAMYDATWGYLPPDIEHLIRTMEFCHEALEYFDSPLCARHAWAIAEDARLNWSEKGPMPKYGFTPRNLRNLAAMASRTPHQGAAIGRDAGWIAWAAAMAFKRRGVLITKGWQRWANLMQQMLTMTALPNGLVERYHDSPQWGPEDKDSAQAFEAVIIAWGAYALATQSGHGHGAWLLESLRQLYRVSPQVPDTWEDGAVGPYHYVYVAEHGGAGLPQITQGKGSDPGRPPGDITHKDAACALAFRLTLDKQWFEVAASTRPAYTNAPRAYLGADVAKLAAGSDEGQAVTLLAEYQRAHREGKL